MYPLTVTAILTLSVIAASEPQSQPQVVIPVKTGILYKRNIAYFKIPVFTGMTA